MALALEDIAVIRSFIERDAEAVRRADWDTVTRLFTPDAIRFALTRGSMSAQGSALTAAQIDALARTLGTAAPAAGGSDNACPGDAASFANPFDQPRWNGWGGNLSQHRFQPAAMAQLPANQVPNLKLKWAFGFPGVNRAFAQPTVVAGRMFVGSARPMVYSLSAATS